MPSGLNRVVVMANLKLSVIRQVAAIVVTVLLFSVPANSQEVIENAELDSHGHINTNPTKRLTVESLAGLSYSWKILSPLGLRETVPMDTLPFNYYQNAVPSMVSAAYATTGNLGAEGMNMIFSERPAMSDFFFRDTIPLVFTLRGTYM